jgi:cytochrome c peroxidase
VTLRQRACATNPDHAYKFRSLTLRQLKDARTFFHNGSFSSIRDVVSYFNDGMPQDEQFAGRAKTLTPRFTHPRGNKAPRGLGLDDQQIDDITEFIEKGLHDPGFVQAFQPNEADLTYSPTTPSSPRLARRTDRCSAAAPSTTTIRSHAATKASSSST